MNQSQHHGQSWPFPASSGWGHNLPLWPGQQRVCTTPHLASFPKLLCQSAIRGVHLATLPQTSIHVNLCVRSRLLLRSATRRHGIGPVSYVECGTRSPGSEVCGWRKQYPTRSRLRAVLLQTGRLVRAHLRLTPQLRVQTWACQLAVMVVSLVLELQSPTWLEPHQVPDS